MNVKRDRWGRYVLPNPLTGDEQSWIRATTVAKVLDDQRALQNWAERQVARGVALREDLRDLAASSDDYMTLKDVAWKAKQAAASDSKANIGTALHQFTEQLDRGQEVTMPGRWADHLILYSGTTQRHGLEVIPRWIERVVLNPYMGVAGTVDRLLKWNGSEVGYIGDLKSGKVEYAWLSIAIQLAIYANATHYYDPQSQLVEPIAEDIDKETALVVHLPASEKGRCDIYSVDLKLGKRAADLALEVLAIRKEKGISSKVEDQTDEPGEPPEFDPKRLDWVRGRVRAIVAAGHGRELASVWTADVPSLKAGKAITNHHVDQIAGWCTAIEKRHKLPFADPDPDSEARKP